MGLHIISWHGEGTELLIDFVELKQVKFWRGRGRRKHVIEDRREGGEEEEYNDEGHAIRISQ